MAGGGAHAEKPEPHWLSRAVPGCGCLPVGDPRLDLELGLYQHPSGGNPGDQLGDLLAVESGEVVAAEQSLYLRLDLSMCFAEARIRAALVFS